jgi:DNA-binding PadR family transcriptional regulator
MRSSVNWALLGLVIERPSYAYDLAQRFERRYGDALTLSNIGHAYTALGSLEDRGLVEEIPGTREGRQPRPHYRATGSGLSAYRQWLIGLADEDRRRSRLFVLALSALAADPEQSLEVVSRYEQTWLSEGMSTAIPREPDDSPNAVVALLQRLAHEESRLAVGAKLAWIEYARQELSKLAERTGRR